MTQIFLTTTGAGTWTSPNNIPTSGAAVKVECIGGGAAGDAVGGAGSGGAYAVSFLTLAANTSYQISVGIGGTAGGAGGDTWFNSAAFPTAGSMP